MKLWVIKPLNVDTHMLSHICFHRFEVEDASMIEVDAQASASQGGWAKGFSIHYVIVSSHSYSIALFQVARYFRASFISKAR